MPDAQFSDAEWRAIFNQLGDANAARRYGMPFKTDRSVTFASWNIRKFGALKDGARRANRSDGAWELIRRFCGQCDLIGIQEAQSDTESLLALLDWLNSNGGDYGMVLSDTTGRAPGRKGMAERFAFIYDRTKIERDYLASDLSMDRTAILDNVKDAYLEAISAELPAANRPGFAKSAITWIENLPRRLNVRFKTFVEFIRSPHVVEFTVRGAGGELYALHCINAHLVSGESRLDRANEFFALLEWLLYQSPDVVEQQKRIILLTADLNLDFESDVDKRRHGVAQYITDVNRKRGMDAKVNFPFLDGNFFTNARKNQTFDHIAYIANDSRWPRAHHNSMSGKVGVHDFEYGMFDFVRLFADAGPGKDKDGAIRYEAFQDDVSDHMPIWLRLPLPHQEQRKFVD